MSKKQLRLKLIELKLDYIILQGEKMATAIQQFADRMTEHNVKVDTAVDGLTADVAELGKQIADLQASAGKITPEDQALLDGIEAKHAAVSQKLEALDALTPPVVPSAQ